MSSGSQANQLYDHESGDLDMIQERSKGKNIFFSPQLEIKQAGKLTDFHVRTEQMQLLQFMQRKTQQQHQQKYDFSMSTSLVMADADDFIFTKLIVVSPKYVLVNQMKAPIEVAQIYTEEQPLGRQVMDVGDRKEWVWSDFSKENLICVRKMGRTDYEASCWSDSDSAFDSGSDDDIEEENSSDDFQRASDDDEDLDDS